jgi:hypothetical protein
VFLMVFLMFSMVHLCQLADLIFIAKVQRHKYLVGFTARF